MSALKKKLTSLFTSKLSKKEVKNTISKINYNSNKIEIIKIPNINNTGFRISKWFCKVGEFVDEGDIICELENETVTIEFESFVSGKLVEISTKKGVLLPDEIICILEKE